MAIKRGPKPTVIFDGSVYSLRRYSTAVPDLPAMSRIEATLWLISNTVPHGYSKPAHPLAGYPGKIIVREVQC